MDKIRTKKKGKTTQETKKTRGFIMEKTVKTGEIIGKQEKTEGIIARETGENIAKQRQT